MVWEEAQTKGQHLLLKPLEVDLLDDFMLVTLPPDETHEYRFLQRTQIFSNVTHTACTQAVSLSILPSSENVV